MKKLPLILMLALGILTPVAATLLFYFAPPQTHTARGEILPHRRAPEKWNLGGEKWTLLFAADACGALCKKRLCQMRQLRLMLPGNYFRLQRAWLRPPAANNAPALSDITAHPGCGEARAAAFAGAAKKVNITEGVLQIRGGWADLPPAETLPHESYLYLIDPSGVFALRFAPATDIYAVRKDLAKLLKISKKTTRIKRGE
ncbi:MAG: hypothetical protein HAW59_05645 [Betaproteobacteria bacterium]|nr:hypothetical protein [Betaproteobacteria bacterium]